MKSDRLILLADFLQGRGKYLHKGLNKKKFYMGTWQQSARRLAENMGYDGQLRIPKKTKEYVKTVGEGMAFKGTTHSSVIPIKCMTVGCAMGWATTLSEFRRAGLKLQATHLGEFAVPEYDGEIGFYAASTFFDLSMPQTEYLFDPIQYTDKNSKDLDYVANRIRALGEGKPILKRYRVPT